MNLRINLVIPTRDRAETLFWALKSCLIQDYPDYQIWVSDNCSNDNTEEVVHNFNDPRIIYLKTAKRISMADNWEFALNHIEEGYVIFIGDDDGLVPGSLAPLAELIKKTCAEAVRPYPVTYFWPDAVTKELSGFMAYFSDNHYWNIDTEILLKYVSQSLNYSPDLLLLPTLYYGATDIEVIKRIKKRDGNFFHSPLPDVYSSVIIASEIDKYIYSQSPVCIGGTSKFSTGQALSSSNENPFLKNEKSKFFREEKKLLHKKLESADLRLNMHSSAVIAAEAFLQAREKNKRVPEINIKSLLEKIILRDTAHFSYDDCIESAMIIAKINGLEYYAGSLIEMKQYSEKVNPNFQIEKLITVNTLNLGINNVYDAALYIASQKELKPVFSPPDLIVSPSDYQDFYRLLLLNFIAPKVPASFNFTNNQISFFIRYSWDNETTYPDGYFIFMPVDSSFILNEKNAETINQNVDQIWLTQTTLIDEYKAAGVSENKIKLINPQQTLKVINELITDLQKKPVLRFNQDLYFYEAGMAYIEQKKYKEAINSFTECIKLNRNNFLYYKSLALCLEKSGDPITAELYYKKAEELT